MKERNPVLVLFGSLVFFAITCVLTIIAFNLFLTSITRAQTYYIEIVLICIAEFVFYIYTAYSLIAGGKEGGLDPAVRQHIHVFIGMWWGLLLFTGFLACLPSVADTFFGDRIILIQAIITFVLFILAYQFSMKSLQVSAASAEKQEQREEREKYEKELALMIPRLQKIGEKSPDHLISIDRLIKKVQTVKGGLSASPKSALVLENKIKEMIAHIQSLEKAEAEKRGDILKQIESNLSDISNM